MTESIIRKQREFFASGKTLDVQYRKNALSDLRQGILDMEPEIGDALKKDLGKSRVEGYMCETGMALSELSYMIGHIGRFARKRRVRTPIAQFPARSYMIPEPYGNVLIMSPWNYPFLLCISPLIGAIAAGNTAIVKPSAYSPATSAVIKKLIEKTFSPEYVTVIEGGRDVNSDLLEQKFDYIFFTGSKTVGRIVMEKAAQHLTPVTLELGGKSPVIVTGSADLKIAARRIVFGKFLNCGQTCVAPDYILVHKSVEEEFSRLCIENIKSMFGESALSNKNYGHIVNRKHFDRLSETICSSGGKILYGGNKREESLQIAPTVISLGSLQEATASSAEIMQDEIFGPVMPIISWSAIEDVISYINSQPRPLATYIFSGRKEEKDALLKRLHFGGGCVNDTIIHLATDYMPFGGVGESGMGGYHGKFGFETFSHIKSIVDKPTWLDLPMRYQPYSALKEKIIRAVMK